MILVLSVLNMKHEKSEILRPPFIPGYLSSSVPLSMPALLAHFPPGTLLNIEYGSNTVVLAVVLIISHETQASCFTPLSLVLCLPMGKPCFPQTLLSVH